MLCCRLAPAAEAQSVARPGADQLPPVTVTPPEARPRSRSQADRAASGSHENPAVVQPSAARSPSDRRHVGFRFCGAAGLQPSAPPATSTISGEEMNARPASRVGELLEAVPGLIVTQHSGEGKANQYFLRGFNLDHGTDLAITVDGMPVNMPHPWPRPGLCRHQLPDSRTGRSRSMSARVPTSPTRAISLPPAPSTSTIVDQTAEEPRRDHLRQLRLCARARRRLDAVGAGTLLAAVEGTNTTARGTCPTTCASSTACCATARAPRRTALRCRRWAIPTAGIRPTRWRSAPSTRTHRPVRHARPDRRRHLQPLQPVQQLGAFERIRPEQGQRLCGALVDAAVQQFHLFARRPRQWRPVQPARPPHAIRPQRQPQFSMCALPASRRKPASGCIPAATISMSACSAPCSATTLSTVREDQRQGRQPRPVGRYHGALDRLAAHHGRRARGLFRRPRCQRHAGKFRQRLGDASPARKPASCWVRGTRPSSSAMPATACTPTTSGAPPSPSIPTTR